jgi:hypothetical protein
LKIHEKVGNAFPTILEILGNAFSKSMEIHGNAFFFPGELFQKLAEKI